MTDKRQYGLFDEPDENGEGITPSHPDICRNNHGGNEDSEAANRGTNKSRDCARILAWIRGRGAYGAITDEVQAALGIVNQTCSARMADLTNDGHVVWSGAKRKTRSNRTAGVRVAKEFYRPPTDEKGTQ